ncbi:MAG: cation diffusion facilitator family transporter [Flavobacteriales bacterium]|jgi:cobalt-zinc-cadmium efflux system protein|tara:strand:- start:3698 stop:4621 length:924 start_codon:yes stop_codon:yes gene_type:complete
MKSNHTHTHVQNHDHSDLKGKKLLFTIGLNIFITLAQAVGGMLSGSLALLSDALHNLTDVISLIISYVANLFTKKEASEARTFGYKRAEIIAAFVNSTFLLIIAIYLIYEAILRFYNPQEIESNVVIWLALLAIFANGFSVLLLKSEAKENMNMLSAYLHLFTDMAASVAVLIGGLLMKYFHWFWVDSLLTILIGLYLIFMGYDLLKKSFKILMLFTPEHISLEEVTLAIKKNSAIKNVHHVHVWELNEDEVHIEAHIEFYNDIKVSEFDIILEEIEQILLQDFNINHSNFQPEFKKDDPKNLIIQD